MQWGLIGCGEIAKKAIMPAFAAIPEANIAMCYRRNRMEAQEFAKSYNMPVVAKSITELVNSLNISAIYIATPPDSHLDIIELASAAGKHILCEKPLSANQRDASFAVEACKQENILLGVSYYRRLFPLVKKIKTFLDKKNIGDILNIKINCGMWYEPPKNSWRLDSLQSGGGVLADIGSHRLDLLNYFFGPPATIFASLMFERAWPVEDAATLNLTWETGLRATLVSSFSQETPVDLMNIYGTKASIMVPLLSGEEIIIQQGSRAQIINVSPRPKGTTHIDLIRDFEAAIREKRSPICNGEQGLMVNKMLEASY
ncbi:MAG: Gfo/Idh/MocA family oxidoreductase, partial [Elusimicrobiota bacterium]